MPAAEPPEAARSATFQHVKQWLAQAGHPHAPQWLARSARTCAEAAQALGVAEGQIAKSVIFRREADGRAVLVIAAGDRRVDAAKVQAQVGAVGRADAAFVKAATGFSIGGVAPVGHATAPVVLVDASLARFDAIWAAAGHPHGVFQATPAQLAALARVVMSDVTEG